MKQKPEAVHSPPTKNIIDLLKNGTHRAYRYEGCHASLGAINVLPQPRKTFEGLEELSLDIAKKKLLNPPTIAKFTAEQCDEYLALVNHLWGSEHRRLQLISTKEKDSDVFYVLLAGERRVRACRLLWEKGCIECIETYSVENAGCCFVRHFENAQIETRLCLDIHPLSALFLQLSENTHMAVPAHEEATAYALLFKLLKQADDHYTIAGFSREVGRSPETIRRALRWYTLPDFAKEAVEKGQVAYGVAIELARLQECGLKHDALQWWLMRAVVESKKVPEFRELVTKHLEAQKSGQISLLGIFQEGQEEQYRRSHIRRVVGQSTVRAIWSWMTYFETVLRLFNEGKLGREDSPFSEGSTLRIFRSLIEKQESLIPHLEGLMPTQTLEQAKTTLTACKQLAMDHQNANALD